MVEIQKEKGSGKMIGTRMVKNTPITKVIAVLVSGFVSLFAVKSHAAGAIEFIRDGATLTKTAKFKSNQKSNKSAVSLDNADNAEAAANDLPSAKKKISSTKSMPNPIKTASKPDNSSNSQKLLKIKGGEAQANKGSIFGFTKKLLSNTDKKPTLTAQAVKPKTETTPAKPKAQISYRSQNTGDSVSYVSYAQMAKELNISSNNSSNNEASFQTISTRYDNNSGTKIGTPYRVNGLWYIPSVEKDYDEKGKACTYDNQYQGKVTANGETYDKDVISVAHPTLPMPGLVEVTNLENGHAIIARVNDRGPFNRNCMVSVSQKAAKFLGMEKMANVRVEYVGMDKPKANKLPPQQLALNEVSSKTATQPVTAPILAEMINPNAQTQTIKPASNKNMTQLAVFAQINNAKNYLASLGSSKNAQIMAVETQNGTRYRVVAMNDTAPALKAPTTSGSIDHNSILASL